jgi:Asp-tRNA(Asn)/Glu-tRNA(Gln) amidotransferase A subunit family amidase
VYSTAVQNITGHPAISIPFGRLPTGLPFGLQVTGEHYHDLRLLDIAQLLEETYPWVRTAPGYETLGAMLNLA